MVRCWLSAVASLHALWEDTSGDHCVLNTLLARSFSDLHFQSTRRGEKGWQDSNQYPLNTIPSLKSQKNLTFMAHQKKEPPNSMYKSCGTLTPLSLSKLRKNNPFNTIPTPAVTEARP